MNKTKFKALLGEILDSDMMSSEQDLVTQIEEEAMRLFESGGIDPEAYEDDDFTPVKICLAVALSNIADEYAPISPEAKKIFANLKHF